MSLSPSAPGLNPPRRYLSPEFAVGGEGGWSYSYTLNINAVDPNFGPMPQTWLANGAYADLGTEELTLQTGDTVSAYKVSNTYTIEDQSNPLGGETTEAYMEQWWVKGLGLVKEVHIDAGGATLLSKDLISYTGLTIE